MVSDQRPKRLVLAGAALLAIAAWSAGSATAAPVRLGASAVAALAAAVLIRRGLTALSQLPPLEVAVGVPPDQALLAARALGLESQLEHAPVALFRIFPSRQNAVEPANASARRLTAPGRASDVAALHRALAGLVVGQRCIIDFDTERGSERALATANAMTIDGDPQRLAALMPMEDELEAEAMQAWQKLVHVLTHEIMNSLTPIASLSRTARDLLDDALDGSAAGLPPDVGADLKTALDAINRRADSLVDFVASYRSLSNLPAARPERVALAALFDRVDALVGPGWRARGGDVTFAVQPASLELMVDPGQLEQALINLLKNAFEATRAGGQARVEARLVRGSRLRIEVVDDGAGIPEASVPHIFTPFYTTKKQGGGIGLAMVRHLVHANGGTVRYAKSVGQGARFVIGF